MWTPSEAGFYRRAGGLFLAVTNQSASGFGWCWHVQSADQVGSEMSEIASAGGKQSSDDAKRAAEEYARDFCVRTLAAIGAPE